MPNLFAYVVLFTFPFVAILLFRRLPFRLALVWVIFGGYMVLPDRAGFNLPVLPKVDKALLPSLMALILCLAAVPAERRRMIRAKGGATSQITDRQVSRQGFVSARTRPLPDARMAVLGPGDHTPARTSVWIALLVFLCLISPVLTTMNNTEPVFHGPTVLRAVSIKDTWAMFSEAVVMLIPFMLARRFLSDPASHALILKVMCYMALGMSLAILVEVRLSPQLNLWIYGFRGPAFDQHIRAGGYRPMLFLQHGLWVGIIISMSVIAALTLFRGSTGPVRWRWLAVAGWLFITLVISKTVGALALCLIMAAAVLFLPRRGQIVVAAVFAGAVALYPMLRSSGVVPVDAVYEFAQGFSEQRAASFMFRLNNEEQLLARASEKPLTGWGGSDRPAIYDDITGDKLSIADGSWIIVIGVSGWIGYLGLFGLLCLPLILIALGRRPDMTQMTTGLLLMLTVNIIDLIPNATLTPVTWLLAGSVAGFYEMGRKRVTAAKPFAAHPA